MHSNLAAFVIHLHKDIVTPNLPCQQHLWPPFWRHFKPLPQSIEKVKFKSFNVLCECLHAYIPDFVNGQLLKVFAIFIDNTINDLSRDNLYKLSCIWRTTHQRKPISCSYDREWLIAMFILKAVSQGSITDISDLLVQQKYEQFKNHFVCEGAVNILIGEYVSYNMPPPQKKKAMAQTLSKPSVSSDPGVEAKDTVPEVK
jgi:hypothetical protein